MLERPTLLLLPWNDATTPRGIVDAATREPLGNVRWRARGTEWSSWLTAPVLEVRESGDEPLVFTLTRYWNWGVVWQVREADGHRVAQVSRGEVRNRADLRLALLREYPQRSELAMLGRDGRPLALVSRGDEGDVLSFATEVGNHPFVKMALLAAALTRSV